MKPQQMPMYVEYSKRLASNSSACSQQTAGGKTISDESHAINGVGAQADNLFKFTSGVHILEITGTVTAVVDSTTLSGVKFVMYDGINTVDITSLVDISGCTVGDKIVKTLGKAGALIYMKADQCRIEESSFNKPFVESIINAKHGVDNYIQVVFTGDASTDVTMDFCVKYAPIYRDASVVAI